MSIFTNNFIAKTLSNQNLSLKYLFTNRQNNYTTCLVVTQNILQLYGKIALSYILLYVVLKEKYCQNDYS